MAPKNDENFDIKSSESSHYLNNLTTAVNELFGLGKKEEMGATKTMSSEIYESNGNRSRNESRTPGSKSNLHVLTQDHSHIKKETVIQEDTLIRGEVLSTSNMNIAGSIKGSVSCEGDIFLTGKIYGNMKGNSITIKDGLVEGNILAKSDITFLGDTTVVGDIETNNFVSEGKIKGHVKAFNSVSLRTPAVLYGNINAKTINMQDGVILDGNVKIMGDVSVETLFQDLSSKIAEKASIKNEDE